MKKLFTGNYTLDVPTRTITLADIALSPEQVLMVTNVTAGHVYHMFTSETPANISVVGGDTRIVFQPFKDCDAHNNTDRLSIYIEDGSLNSTAELIGTYTFTDRTDPIDLRGYPPGSVFIAHCNWTGGAGDIIEIRRSVALFPSASLLGFTVTFYNPDTQEALTTVGTGGHLGAIIFRNPSPNAGFEGVVFNRVSGAGGTKTLKLFVLGELSYGTGYPHINIGSLVYPLDNNLKVSDFQSQARLGDVTDAPAASDNPNDKGLIPLVKRLLGTKLPDKNSDGRIPVDIGGNGSITVTSGTITVSNEVEVTNAVGNPIPVSGPLTDAELRDSPVPVSGPLTDAELRDSPVPVSGPLTDAELRDSPIPVSGPLTDAELRDSPVPVSGPLTDAELRDSPVPVSGPLTDAELRDSPVPVSGAHGAINTSSAELTTSNSVEVLAASSAATPRRYLFLQNLSTAPIYVNFTNNATATSMRLDAGSSLAFEGNFVPNNSVNLLRSTTTNQRYFLMHATY